MNAPITDHDVELLLAGRVPSQRQELDALRTRLEEHQNAVAGPPPVPSGELAALMAAGGRVGVVPTVSARRRAALAAGAVTVVVAGLGSVGVLPAAAQNVFNSVLRVLVQHDGGHGASGRSTLPESGIGSRAGGHGTRGATHEDQVSRADDTRSEHHDREPSGRSTDQDDRHSGKAAFADATARPGDDGNGVGDGRDGPVEESDSEDPSKDRGGDGHESGSGSEDMTRDDSGDDTDEGSGGGSDHDTDGDSGAESDDGSEEGSGDAVDSGSLPSSDDRPETED